MLLNEERNNCISFSSLHVSRLTILQLRAYLLIHFSELRLSPRFSASFHGISSRMRPIYSYRSRYNGLPASLLLSSREASFRVPTVSIPGSLVFSFSLYASLPRVFISASYLRTALTQYLVSEAQIHIFALNPRFTGRCLASDVGRVHTFSVHPENIQAAMIS